jgi:hypothetical protein
MHFVASKAEGGAFPDGRNRWQKWRQAPTDAKVRTSLKPRKALQREELS